MNPAPPATRTTELSGLISEVRAGWAERPLRDSSMASSQMFVCSPDGAEFRFCGSALRLAGIRDIVFQLTRSRRRRVLFLETVARGGRNAQAAVLSQVGQDGHHVCAGRHQQDFLIRLEECFDAVPTVADDRY